MAAEVAEFERNASLLRKRNRFRSDRGKGIAGEIALARGESPAKGKQFLDLPGPWIRIATYKAALVAGKIRQEHAQSIAKATEVLSEEHRRKVDAVLKDRLGVASPKDLGKHVELCTNIDHTAAATRHRSNDARRHVSTCHGMAPLTAYGLHRLFRT